MRVLDCQRNAEDVDQRAAALQNEVKAYYQMQAEQRKVSAAEPTMTDLEKQAARLLIERVAPAGGGPGGGGPGGGGGGAGGGQQAQAVAQLSPQERAALAKVPPHMTAELNILLGQKKTALEIRDFLSGEFEPVPLADLMELLRVREKLGTVKVTEKPEEKPAPPEKKPAKKKK